RRSRRQIARRARTAFGQGRGRHRRRRNGTAAPQSVRARARTRRRARERSGRIVTRRSASAGERSARRREAYLLGLRAETLAALRLRLAGWRILERRFLAGGGEIDLVALRGDYVVFVEVKARVSFEAAALSITPQ